MASAPVKINNFAVELIEFFEVATHEILYQRGVYPSEIFRTVKKYDIATHQSRHPQLNNYIAKALIHGIYAFLSDGTLEKYVIILMETKSKKIIEKYVFDLEMLMNKNKYIDPQKERKDLKLLKQKLRDVLVKITAMNSSLKSNQNELTFTIQSHTSKFDRSKYTKWIEMQQQSQQNSNKKFQIIPIRNFSTQQIKLNVMILQNSNSCAKK